MLRRALCALLLLGGADLARAQSGTSDREARYGKPVDVELSDVALNPEMYRDRAIRTKGRLEQTFGTDRGYAITDMNAQALIYPVNDICSVFEEDARRWLGDTLEVTGGVAGVQGAGSAGRSASPRTSPSRPRRRRWSRCSRRRASRTARSYGWWGSSAGATCTATCPRAASATATTGSSRTTSTRSGSRARSRRAPAGRWTRASSATPASGSRWSVARTRATASCTCARSRSS